MDIPFPFRALRTFLFPAFLVMGTSLLGASPLAPDEYHGPPPGARSLGLGNAAIALADEPFTSFYNPASLCFLKSSVVVFDFHYARGGARQYDLPNVKGVTLDFVGMLNQSGGLSWHPLTRRTFEAETTYYDQAYGDTVSVISRYEYRADEVYSTMTTLTTEQFDVLLRRPLLGINLKYLRAQCAEAKVIRAGDAIVDATSNIDSGNGFGVDVGFSYATEIFLFGLSVKNAFSRVYWKDYDTDNIPMVIGTGISYMAAERATMSTDFRYDWESKKTGCFSGLELNLLRKKASKTKHRPVGETAPEEPPRGNIVRAGVRIPDLSNAGEITYSIGYAYRFSRIRFDIAFMGEQEQIKEGEFASQVSLLILY